MVTKSLTTLPLAFSRSDCVVTSEGLLSPGLLDNLHSGREKIETATEKMMQDVTIAVKSDV